MILNVFVFTIEMLEVILFSPQLILDDERITAREISNSGSVQISTYRNSQINQTQWQRTDLHLKK